MMKKLLSLLVLGVISVTSLPAVGVSAAEVNASNIESNMSVNSSSARTYVGTYYIDKGAYAYTFLPINQERFAGRVSSDVKCAVYTNSVTEKDDANRKYYYVRCKVNGNSKYDFYYVYRSSVQTPN